MTVGRSWRTAAKHDIMASFVGQEIGAASRIPRIRCHVWYDLTAGDAATVDGCPWHRSSSPGILAYHASRSTKPVVVVLYEIKPATFDRLIRNLTEHLPVFGYERHDDTGWVKGNVGIRAVNDSGMSARTDIVQNGDAVLVFNDPNAITEWAMRGTFLDEIAERGAWACRSMSTMGCNAAGVKRLAIGERVQWFDLLSAQENSLPAYRDLLLAAIERDAAQWAYLFSTASKWSGSFTRVVESAFRRVGRTAEWAWFRQDRGEYEAAKRRLFLTKKELGVA